MHSLQLPYDGTSDHCTPAATTNRVLPALATLQAHPRWVCWQYSQTASGKKPRKEPYNGNKPSQKASTRNPLSWCEYATALQAQQQYGFTGIGFVAGDGITFVDLDHCLDAEGQPNDDARQIVTALNSYTEVSPSGTGLKIFVLGTVPDNIGSGGSVEIYSQGQYSTVTGNHVPGTPTEIRDAQAALDALYGQYRHTPRARPTAAAEEPRAEESIDWPAAEIQRYLTFIKVLLDKDGIPSRFTERSQGRRALTDLPRLLTEKPQLTKWLVRQSGESNASMVRAIVAHSLRTYSGYPFAPSAALMWHLFRYHPEHNTRAGRADRWWRNEITRLWHKAEPAKKGERPIPLPGDCPAATLSATAPKRRRGRPTKIDSPDAYLAWLVRHADAHTSIVMKSVSELAALFTVTKRTIQRYEEALRTRGLIERRTYANRQQGCVYLLAPAIARSDKNADMIGPQDLHTCGADVVTADARVVLSDAVNRDTNSYHKETRVCRGPALEGANAHEYPQDDSAEPTISATTSERPLREVVREALQCYPQMGRRRLRAVLQHAAMYGYTDDVQVKAAYKAETSDFRWIRADARRLTDDALLQQIVTKRRVMVNHAGEPREGYHRTVLAIYEEECQRRHLALADVHADRTHKRHAAAQRAA